MQRNEYKPNHRHAATVQRIADGSRDVYAGPSTGCSKSWSIRSRGNFLVGPAARHHDLVQALRLPPSTSPRASASCTLRQARGGGHCGDPLADRRGAGRWRRWPSKSACQSSFAARFWATRRRWTDGSLTRWRMLLAGRSLSRGEPIRSHRPLAGYEIGKRVQHGLQARDGQQVNSFG